MKKHRSNIDIYRLRQALDVAQDLRGDQFINQAISITDINQSLVKGRKIRIVKGGRE